MENRPVAFGRFLSSVLFDVDAGVYPPVDH